MISLFKYESTANSCVLNTEGLILTKEFLNLKEYCDNRIRGKNKKGKLTDLEQAEANNLFFEFCKYIFLAYDIASKLNPYREFTQRDREIAAQKDCNLTLSDYTIPELDACINKIQDIFESDFLVKFINKCYVGINKLGDYYDAVDFTLTSKTGELVHNANTLKGNLKESANLVKTIQDLRDSLNKALESDTLAVRGGQTTGRVVGKR